MLYDNVRYLGDIFHHFLRHNSELFQHREACPSVSHRAAVQDAEMPLRRRLEAWLDTVTTLTDLTHRATLLQLADTYETLQQLRDTHRSNGVAFSPLQEDGCYNGKTYPITF
jgi:hypothetical protein